jgi:hypothetical protein
MCSQNSGNAISETQILKISWGGDMPPALTPLANSRLRYSAHTFGDRMRIYYAGGGQGKWALWQFCPTTEESLKNALVLLAVVVTLPS